MGGFELPQWRTNLRAMQRGAETLGADRPDGAVPALIAARMFEKNIGWIYYHLDRGDIPCVGRLKGKRGARLVRPQDIRKFLATPVLYTTAEGKEFRRVPGYFKSREPETLRNDRLWIRLRKSELAAVRRIANESGQSQNEFCRAAILDAIDGE